MNQHSTPTRHPTVIPSNNSIGPRNMLNIKLPKRREKKHVIDDSCFEIASHQVSVAYSSIYNSYNAQYLVDCPHTTPLVKDAVNVYIETSRL